MSASWNGCIQPLLPNRHLPFERTLGDGGTVGLREILSGGGGIGRRMREGVGVMKSEMRLVQLPIFQEAVFKRESLLLALAPFLKVEINVGAL